MISASNVAFCDYLQDLLETNKASLGLQMVTYGDQLKIPVSPMACIEPGVKHSELIAAHRGTEVTLTNYVIVYNSAITSVQQNRRDADVLAEAIETLINSKATANGLVIHCFVTDIASGYITKDTSVLRASKITINAVTRDRLPMI